LSGKELDGYQGPLKARFAFAHFAKILNGHRPNSATCQPIPVMFGSIGWGFRQGRMELHYFGFAEMQDGDHFEKFKGSFL